jgi:hypothetical protein
LSYSHNGFSHSLFPTASYAVKHLKQLPPLPLAAAAAAVLFLRAGQLLPVWLTDADWRKRHAALICLAQIAEGCEKLMGEQVEGLVGMCLTGLRDSHPKVRGQGLCLWQCAKPCRAVCFSHGWCDQ